MRKLSKINESVWGDLRKRSSGEVIRREDELTSEEKRQFISWYVRSFASAVVFHDKYENSLDGFKKMFSSHKKLQIPTENKIGEMAYLISNWNDGDNIQQQVNDDIQKLEKRFPSDFKKEPGKSIHDTLLDWWNTLDTEKKKDIIYNAFENSEYQNELFNEYGDDVDEYDDKTLDTIWDKEIAYYEQAKYYLEYHKTNESVWGDLRKRSSGEVIRREDDINLMDKFTFSDYLKRIYDCENPYDITAFEQGGMDELIACVFRNKANTTFYSLTVHDYNTEPYITFNIEFKSFFERNYNEFDVWEDTDETSGNDILVIRPKDDKDYTNSFFIKVLDFLLTFESKTLIKLIKKK